VDIDLADRQPPEDEAGDEPEPEAKLEPELDPDEPWLHDSWFEDPWLDASWTTGPWPPAWAPPDVVPRALAARRQTMLDEIGRAVLQLRLLRRWTQRDVEMGSGVDQTTISRLERGRQRGLSILALAAILEALKVGRVQFLPPRGPEPTTFELMLDRDRWKRAGDAAERRLARGATTQQERLRR
jgi:transcriptional regulator with XRE-family HTH domain